MYDSRDNCNAIIKTRTNRVIVECKNTDIPDGVTPKDGDNNLYDLYGSLLTEKFG